MCDPGLFEETCLLYFQLECHPRDNGMIDVTDSARYIQLCGSPAGHMAISIDGLHGLSIVQPPEGR